MASQVTNYQCPACTGPMHFDGPSGLLQCDYCGSSYTPEEVEALYAEKNQDAVQSLQEETEPAYGEEGSWSQEGESSWGEEQNLRVYSCPSCGAELICDSTTAATFCPYCGNPSVIPGQLTGTFQPDYIIPFKVDKEAALKALKNHYKKRPLLPKAFSDENHIEKVTGVYVPFWLFDSEVDADIAYHATRTTVMRTKTEEIVTTFHYRVERDGTVAFERVPVDASSKMDDAHMDSIEPYDYSEMVPFSTAYLPGFLADKYDVPVDDCAPRAEERVRQSTENALRDSVHGYETCVAIHKNMNLKRGHVGYALLPVWILNTKWRDKNYLFAMNGQTGKLIGDLPVSKGRVAGWFTGICAGTAAAVFAALMLLL